MKGEDTGARRLVFLKRKEEGEEWEVETSIARQAKKA